MWKPVGMMVFDVIHSHTYKKKWIGKLSGHFRNGLNRLVYILWVFVIVVADLTLASAFQECSMIMHTHAYRRCQSGGTIQNILAKTLCIMTCKSLERMTCSAWQLTALV